MSEEKLPSWLTFVAESLESHLQTFESPILEILPHPVPDRGPCGKHEAFKTHLHHFCLFLCCGKELSRFCLKNTAFNDGDEEENDVSGNGCSQSDGNGDGKNGIHSTSNQDRRSCVDTPSAKSLSLFNERVSRLGLMAQPEDYRIWNVLKHPRLDPMRELKFGYFILTRHSRSSETFCHLRHVTRRACSDATQSVSSICTRGFAECAGAASRYHGNYHAWDHRRFLVSLLVDAGEDKAEVGAMIQKELDGVKAWQSSRVSDACPFKYRLFLVEIRSKARLDGLKFDFGEELLELNRLMRVYPGHETLWNHRRDLMELARRDDPASFDVLVERDDEFLHGLQAKAKNDWEMMLHDRYVKFSETLKPMAEKA